MFKLRFARWPVEELEDCGQLGDGWFDVVAILYLNVLVRHSELFHFRCPAPSTSYGNQSVLIALHKNHGSCLDLRQIIR